MADQDYRPDDRLGYFQTIRERVSDPDPTAIAYLAESVDAFGRGSLVAAAMMLGVAAERVLILLCESFLTAVVDPAERERLGALLSANAVEPKVGWIRAKLRALRDSTPPPAPIPADAELMVAAIHDLIRHQRNDLGHPRDAPPAPSREEVQANLLMFPRHYETAERLRMVLAIHQL